MMDNEWFDLRGAAEYINLSERTLRRYMNDPDRPLPFVRLHVQGKARGVVRISRRAFEKWLEQFRVEPVTMDAKVAEAVRSIRGC